MVAYVMAGRGYFEKRDMEYISHREHGGTEGRFTKFTCRFLVDAPQQKGTVLHDFDQNYR